jgi:hypothetical protein
MWVVRQEDKTTSSASIELALSGSLSLETIKPDDTVPTRVELSRAATFLR